MRSVVAGAIAAPLLLAAVGVPAYAEEPTSSLSGTVFFDANGDGVQQEGEAGAAGFEVNFGAVSFPEGGTAVTDENGHYRFDGITAKGKYSLQLDGQGHAHTTPWAVGGSFGNGGVDVTHDFGIE
ncbi:SdrD B-like domain-containing protein [Saccharopolyspora sp. NPDC047091]|uniref:SdrD B-like domain-containing protein n=1 Tax=Saccharopolyspora sp. NPDC047091 TaxID=3155924 RepID=UPI0033C6B109